ncbi:MAG: NB-ARC domain-containing protein, partial [Cyanobacteria bacterium P01_A01_bin.114]
MTAQPEPLGYLSPNIPRLPPKFLPRPEDLDALKTKILNPTQAPVAVTGTRRGVSIQGMGGIGKSVLAAAIARDKAVRQAFPDGVFWVALGQEPQVLALQTELARELGEDTPDFSDVTGGKKRLTELFSGQACLLVLDDIWQITHLTPFDVLSDRSQMLITTRDSGLVTGIGAVEHALDVLSSSQANLLLAGWMGCEPGTLPVVADEIARECGYLPLALAMAGAMLKKSRRWDGVLQRLQRADLDKIKQQFPDYPYPDLLKMLQVSVDALEPDLQARYLDFAVFSEDARIPETVLQTLWAPLGLDDLDTGEIIDELLAKSLLRRDEQDQLFLHDLQYDYITKQIEDLPALHQRLLAAYAEKCDQGWASGPQDGYFFEQLVKHLMAANKVNELSALLLDYNWLQTKLRVNGINDLLIDYDWLPNHKALNLVQSTLRLSAHVLVTQPEQLTERLCGHLMGDPQLEIKALLDQAAAKKTALWLWPTQSNLATPNGPLLRTLSGHGDWVRAVAITSDGKRAISGAYDNTLKVWDLETGETLSTFSGHGDRVRAVAITPDGKHAVSGSEDNTLKVWDLETGEALSILSGHSGRVRSVAISPNGKWTISGSDDNTLKVWDLETGEALSTLSGHSDWVNSVTFTPNGQWAISGSY